ncbi:hypothetical protein [Butyrivibrio sp. AC2005]|uniref:hypothetical protein n=1 Tax=Butyrivibrio sp. AC2005 TaxID=1280672 RepID=UPI00041FB0C9|nr:hypothetical protein [Butyrivibrio sp. AC2005]
MKSRILILIVIIAAVVMVIGSVFVNANQETSEEALTIKEHPGFSEITSVPGVSFYINSPFVEKATAITQISDNISFQKNQYYSYKNGTDKYLLFNMESLIVAVQKGTDFWIEESSDKEYSLLNTSLMNIWFTQGTKKFSSETENGMTITKACAGVSINSTTYGDFAGELANINKDGEEWSIFVGVPGERYDKISSSAQDGIRNIINSFTFSDSEGDTAQDIYAVSLSGDNSREAVDTTEEVFEYDENSLNLSNQSNIVDKDEEKAYTSTPYNMLQLGDNGLLSAFNDYKISYEEPIICPKKVYRGEDAENLIKDYCTASGAYDYFKAPDGQSWEVLEYDLNYKNCENEDYVNIKLKGLDGDALRYRGIRYEGRTYEMEHKKAEDGDWIRTLYVYYPVPNGCYEYCIECGESKSLTSEEVSAAYYYVVNEDEVHSEPSTAESSESKETPSVDESTDEAEEAPASTEGAEEPGITETEEVLDENAKASTEESKE